MCNGEEDFGQYPSTGCASGFVNNGGTCTRSAAFEYQCSQNGGEYDAEACACTGSCNPFCSPIVVDILGNGFAMTSVVNGVQFDLESLGVARQFSWTASGADEAWLALDRNFNGTIDNGRELFGNVTPQEPPPAGAEMHGFRALGLYDQAGYGGNGDGKITAQDSIFGRLKLWQDQNHNGISELCELFSLPDLGLTEIDLDFKESQNIDQYGNQFKYRSKVTNVQGAQLGRWAWDVFLVVQQP